MNNYTVDREMAVTLNFSLMLEDGIEVDSTFDKKPAQLVVGDGNLPEGFENLIMGLKVGDRKQFKVSPENAFGQHNPGNVQRMPRTRFSQDMELFEGVMVSFADKNGAELPGVIKGLSETVVEVDFNHPLAGRAVLFDVQIIDVKPSD